MIKGSPFPNRYHAPVFREMVTVISVVIIYVMLTINPFMKNEI